MNKTLKLLLVVVLFAIAGYIYWQRSIHEIPVNATRQQTIILKRPIGYLFDADDLAKNPHAPQSPLVLFRPGDAAPEQLRFFRFAQPASGKSGYAVRIKGGDIIAIDNPAGAIAVVDINAGTCAKIPGNWNKKLIDSKVKLNSLIISANLLK